MNFVRMGCSGLKLTEITYGTALTIGTESEDLGLARELISTAWDLGIRSFDVSNNYGMGGAERITGLVLRDYPREEFVVTTKGSWPIGETVYHKGLSRKHILWAFEESIKRMGLDYVDIYYAHRYDPETPMDEVVRTYNRLIDSGRVRYWATSEWPTTALEECREVCERLRLEGPILEQFLYSYAVVKAEHNGVVDFCRKNGVGMLGFAPLCQGYLTGKYRNGIPQGSRIDKKDKLQYTKTSNFYLQFNERIDEFLKICDKYAVDPTTVAIRWCLRKGIYPVLGASTPAQLGLTLSNYESPLPDELWDELAKVQP